MRARQLIEKPYEPESGAPAPEVVIRTESEVNATALMGDEDLMVKCLMPDSPAYDFAVNTMTYAPVQV